MPAIEPTCSAAMLREKKTPVNIALAVIGIIGIIGEFPPSLTIPPRGALTRPVPASHSVAAVAELGKMFQRGGGTGHRPTGSEVGQQS